MTATKKTSLLFPTQAWICLAFIVIQQLIVASSTLWIALLAENISRQEPFFSELGLLIGSLVVVYAPAFFGLVFLEKAKWSFIERYQMAFAAGIEKRARLRSDREQRSMRLPFFRNEIFVFSEEASFFFFDAISSALNIIFNLAVFAFILDVRFLIAYGVALVIVNLVVHRFGTSIHQASENAQGARAKLQNHLEFAWETLSIGNKKNLIDWMQGFKIKSSDSSRLFTKSQAISEGTSILGMVVAMIPIIGVIFYLFYSQSDDFTLLAILVATLPRQVQLIQYLYALVNYIARWKSLRARLQGLISRIPERNVQYDETADNRIDWKSIRFSQQAGESEASLNQNSFDGIQDLISFLNKQSHGRILIQGRNGAGKSSVLNIIKQTFADTAYLLAFSNDQYFEGISERSLSSGESLIQRMAWIFKNIFRDDSENSMRILLLDEWDANLDPDRVKEINAIISKAAEKFLIIEARHS